jgi:hypothetical protein
MSTRKSTLYVSVDLLVTVCIRRPCLVDGHREKGTLDVKGKGVVRGEISFVARCGATAINEEHRGSKALVKFLGSRTCLLLKCGLREDPLAIHWPHLEDLIHTNSRQSIIQIATTM